MGRSRERRSRSRDRDRDRDRSRSRGRHRDRDRSPQGYVWGGADDGGSAEDRSKKKSKWGGDDEGITNQALAAVQAAAQVRDAITATGAPHNLPGACHSGPGSAMANPPVSGVPASQSAPQYFPGGEKPPSDDPRVIVTTTGTVIYTIDITEKHCKFVIGKRGEFLKTIERTCKGAFATLDNLPGGKNVVKIQGPWAGVKAAVAMVQLRLAAVTDATALPDGYALQKLEVEQFQVKNLIGPGGSTLRELQQSTGAQITVMDDQTCAKAGIKGAEVGFKGGATCCQVRIVGPSDAVVKATTLVKEKVNCFEDMQVSQLKIGCIIGPKGTTFRDIRNQSGASIWVDQTTQHLGYSIVRIKNPGTPEHARAKQMIMERIGGELYVGPEASAKAMHKGSMQGATMGPGKGPGGMPLPGNADLAPFGGGFPPMDGGSWGSSPSGPGKGGMPFPGKGLGGGSPPIDGKGSPWDNNWNQGPPLGAGQGLLSQSNSDWNSQSSWNDSSGGAKVIAPKAGFNTFNPQPVNSWNAGPPMPLQPMDVPPMGDSGTGMGCPPITLGDSGPGIGGPPVVIDFGTGTGGPPMVVDFSTGPAQSSALPAAPVDVSSMDPIELMLVGEKLSEKGVKVEDLTSAQLQDYMQTGKLPTYSL